MAGPGAVSSVGNSLVGYLTGVNELARAAGGGVQATGLTPGGWTETGGEMG